MSIFGSNINYELIKGEDGLTRCAWHGGDGEYLRYHDEEWGVPVSCDFRLFEKMSLEGFQAGLSWLTILRKRENFRAVFSPSPAAKAGQAGFDFYRIAQFGEADVQRLMADAGIVRHRGKIEAVINNAARAMDVVEEFGSFAAYLWQYEPAPTEWSVRSECSESVALSKDLKARGFKFVGPTTMYALMQAMGMVNDHTPGCYCRPLIEEKRAVFKRPAAC